MGNDRRRGASEENNSQQPAKQKKKRSAPTNTSLLPPCKVCLEPAAGFHYGVNTCEACKGFFRRTLVRQGDYECINHDEKCDIVQGHRNSKKRMCPRCRHLKCIAVGMSPDAIKTGRYTHAKRTQDTMEYHQSLGLSDSSNISQPSPEKPAGNTAVTTVTSPSSSSMTSDLSSPAAHTTEQCKASGSCRCAEDSNTGVRLSPSVSHKDDTGLSPLVPDVLEVPAMTPSCLDPSHSVSSLETTRRGLTSASASPFSPEDVSPSAFTLVDSIVDHRMGRELGNCHKSDNRMGQEPGNCHKSDNWMGEEPGNCHKSDHRMGREPGNCHKSDHWMGQEPGNCHKSVKLGLSSCQPSAPSPLDDSDVLSEQDCRHLIQQLCQSHQQLILSRYTFTKQEMLEMQQLCYDNCKARMETFGPMGSLSEEEYQDIYQTTGIDVDDRQVFLTAVTKLLDSVIRQSIAFVKTIPGFSELSIKDQITLIKENRFEMGLVTQTIGYNRRLKVMTLPSGRCFCEHDMHKLGGIRRMQQRHHCLSAIQMLGLTVEELVLFKCVMLFTVGNAAIDDPHSVGRIQWTMTQCLLWLLKENQRPNPNLFFAQMISVFITLKTCAADFSEWIRGQPFSQYAQFRNNELLVEWFSTS